MKKGLCSTINWVNIEDRTPGENWGSYLVSLKNHAVFILSWNSVSEKFYSLTLGDVKANNPVKYWADLPDTSCLENQKAKN